MPDRAELIADFLAGAGWGAAERHPLAGDASFRRYERLRRGRRRAVLMDAPPPHENVRPFVAVARHLRRCRLSAPEVLAVDESAGLLLLEDLGDDLYTRILRDGADERLLYHTAVDVLIELQSREAAIELPPYDESRLLAEADLFVEWFLPERAGGPTPPESRAAYRDAWRAVLPLAARLPRRVVLRDYHADNLIWLPARTGTRRCGLLDFQDAVIGPAAYDLVSLLEDARRDVAPDVVAGSLEHYLAEAPGLDAGDFSAGYAVLAAQRNCKIVGIFTRLWRRDGKPQFLDYLPRVWGHLERDLLHPALAPVRTWLDGAVPQAWRGRL